MATQKRREGKKVWAVPYDYIGACEGATDVCLGVPYFNWGPGYVNFIKASMARSWESEWLWWGPDWKDINNPDTSTVGFVAGPALSVPAKAALDNFIRDMGTGTLQLFKGPLYYQDDSLFLKSGQVAADQQIWYLKQLLKGMDGQSSGSY